jgi:hypothetical protein
MPTLGFRLWGSDSGLTGSNGFLYTYPSLKLFPDATISQVESVKFQSEIGEGVLSEDVGGDEIYGLLRLTNMLSGGVISKKTNEVSGSF